ncbi:MAG: hypothetical protein Kow0081_2320 [Candidatus Dojkabacteria bacterium]
MKKGQIMLLTLLVLMIIAIAVIGILNLVIRDSNQVSNTGDYQLALQVSESITQRAVEVYGNNPSLISIEELTGATGDIDSNLSDILDYCTLSVDNQEQKTFECRKNVGTDFTSILLVSDKKEVIDFNLEINRPLTLNLEGYLSSEGLLVSWDSNLVALELSLIYFDSSNTLKVAEALWDSGSLRVSEEPEAIINELPLTTNTFAEPDRSLQIPNFALADVNSLVSITFTPRSKDPNVQQVTLNIIPTDYTTYPFQIREFRTTSFNPNSGSTPSVTTITQIPIEPQLDSIFNYSLITEDSVEIL